MGDTRTLYTIALTLAIILGATLRPSVAETTYEGPSFHDGNTWSLTIIDEDDGDRRFHHYFSDRHGIKTGGFFMSLSEYRYLKKTYQKAKEVYSKKQLSPGSKTSVKIDTPRGYRDGPTIYLAVEQPSKGPKRIVVEAAPNHRFYFYIDKTNMSDWEYFFAKMGEWYIK